ncbi:hypothetical protein B0H34DRAFT_800151 [Crassisporium funariophilum]|nr:hypothetical protein B0H34DRAFT_800151 [Crassisporium funariophilum]
MSSDSPPAPLEKPFVRLATTKDIESIIRSACRAFINDPVMLYFGNAKKLLEEDVDVKNLEGLRRFLTFLLKACFALGGRITVVVYPDVIDAEGSKEEKIVAAALWLPPNKRIEVWKVPTLLRSGVVGVLTRWRLTGLLRIAFEYQDTCHSMLEKCFKTKGVKQSPDAAWYLLFTMTDPDYQGKGSMSLLIREAFAHAPEATFVLEATTAKVRDQYVHLGFELPTPINIGKGKSDRRGVAASGEDAVGLEFWAMAKWPSNEIPSSPKN